jgi:hypothetical protein
VTRPPLLPQIPCETQPAISDLTTAVGAGPQQLATDTPAVRKARQADVTAFLNALKAMSPKQRATLPDRLSLSLPTPTKGK